MPSPLAFPSRRAGHLGVAALATWASTSSSAWAQQADVIRLRCDYNFETAAIPLPASVPSMSLLGVALLVALVAFAAWRLGRFPGARLMSAVLVAAAVLLANQGGGGLVQKAYAAAVSFTNPAGETKTANELHGNPITLTNNAGVPLLLKSVNAGAYPPGNQIGSCTESDTLAPGDTCTGTVDCGLVMYCFGPAEGFNPESPTGCACDENYGRRNGVCQVIFDISECTSFTDWGECRMD